jgi:hypothetical protein
MHVPTCAPNADADPRPRGKPDGTNATAPRVVSPLQPSRPIFDPEGTRETAF